MDAKISHLSNNNRQNAYIRTKFICLPIQND